ncbi:pyridine nucleotide transhydrogenase [Asticcacaulis sp.]|uniref:pyridine nucleotide transhydrogenase n=1 Tax=Asticcacaulis sp. TaxID=1872648 RepID=UPI00262479D9|nr:pyridine nucleotide transhydrogenase [Asticcacaulis sp.]
MREALIGYTGFVGGNLLMQKPFSDLYASANIANIRGQKFDRLVCAGVSAVKWWANENPAEDLAKIDDLISHLSYVESDAFTLISTIDVFKNPCGATEDRVPDKAGLNAYGTNRLYFESFVRTRFPHASIVRLPALFGDNLRKNALYDLINRHRTININPRSAFQWYPLERLARDLDIVEKQNLQLVHFATEPVTMKALIERFFPDAEVAPETAGAPVYDFRTKYAGVFGAEVPYILRQEEIFAAMARMIAKVSAGAL